MCKGDISRARYTIQNSSSRGLGAVLVGHSVSGGDGDYAGSASASATAFASADEHTWVMVDLGAEAVQESNAQEAVLRVLHR